MNGKMKFGWALVLGMVLFLFGGLSAASAQNHTPYRIKKIDSYAAGKAPRMLGAVWSEQTHDWNLASPQFVVTVGAGTSVDTSGVYIRVYFFDEANVLVATQDHPASLRADAQGSFEVVRQTPQKYAPGADFYAQFIPPDVKWTHAVAVFGDATTAVAKVFPGGEVTDFAIPEKDQIDAGH